MNGLFNIKSASPVLLSLDPCRNNPSSNGNPAKLHIAASWSLVELQVSEGILKSQMATKFVKQQWGLTATSIRMVKRGCKGCTPMARRM